MAEIWLRKYSNQAIQMVFKIKVFDNIDWKFSSPISPMPLPEDSGQENILVKMEGNTHSINLTWLVKNETVNQGVSNNTVGGGSNKDTKTIFDVVKWMSADDQEGGFIGRHLDDAYDILIFDTFTNVTTYNMASGGVAAGAYDEFVPEPPDGTDSADPAWTGLVMHLRGYIRQIGFRTGKDEPATLKGAIEFLEGNNIVSYQGSTPNAPQNFRVKPHSVAPSTKVNITFNAPRHTGTSAITKYLIGFKVRTGNDDIVWKLSGSSGTALNVTLTNLTPDTEYEIVAAAYNAEGRGEITSPVYIKTTAS